MANTGRSYEEVDEMTIFDVHLIFDYWSDHPPSCEILTAVHVEKKPDGVRRKKNSKKAAKAHEPDGNLRDQKWIKDLDEALGSMKFRTN